MTYEEAEKILHDRLVEYPEVKALVTSSQFKESLKGILTTVGVDQDLSPLIEHEVLVVASFFVPIGELAHNIGESSGLAPEVAERLANLIETLVLSPITDDLYAFEFLYETEFAKEELAKTGGLEAKERLELRPNVPPSGVTASEGTEAKDAAKPLTRDELMNAIGGKRTMAQDIEALRLKREAGQSGGGSVPPPRSSDGR